MPFYLKLLGAEAYGLIGLFTILQSVFMLADMGLSGTFTRETAKLSAMESESQKMRDLCRTFEVIFAVAGFLGFLAIAASSRLIAEQWVNLQQLSVSTVTTTIILIGITVGLQFPFFIYQGGMQGLQRQSALNFLLVSLGLLRGLGAVLVLMYIAPSIQVFFIWQAVISLIQLVAGHIIIWRSLPKSAVPPRFDLNIIRPLWRFAAGTAGITLSGIILTQIDKLILIKMLPLKEFGYYTLAGVVASVLSMIALPYNNAIYPRFIQLVAAKNFTELSHFYHRSCQFLTVLLIPVGLVLASYSKEFILVWTGNMETAQNTFLLARVLVTGCTLMGLMLIPYSLQLAFAWTQLGLVLNIVAVIILIPLLFWLVSVYGALGACFVWVMLYTGQFIVMIHLMHRRILQGEKWKWYLEDILKPLIAPMVIVAIGRLSINLEMDKHILIISLMAIYLASLLASAMSAVYVRQMVFSKIYTLFRQLQNN